MKTLILALLLIGSTTTFASIITQEDFHKCYASLYKSMYTSDASMFCLKNSSPAFVSCQAKLYESMHANDAARFCLKNSTPDFVACYSKLQERNEMYVSSVARVCLKLHSNDKQPGNF